MQYNTLLGGTYQIKKILVFSAYNVSGIGKKLDTEQPVMLRLWLTARAATAKEQAHIQAEVAALQHIQHPHLLSILDVRASEQGVLLVSEHVQSGSLNGRLQQSLPFEDALHIIKQTGQALHALHQQGITHANLMPYSIFFTESGYVRLGEPRVNSILASIQNYQPALEECVPLCWYMAPEQFQEVRNAQSDQYALGCLAYRLFTGQVPFAGTTRATLLQRHQHDQPKSLLELNPALPPQIEVATLKALAKRPSDRHKSIQAFLEALEETLYTPEIGKQESMLVRSFGPMLAALEALQQPPPVSVFQVPGSTLMDKETFPLSLEPVTAATWTRTRVNAVSPVTFVQSASRRQPPGNFSQIRKLLVLLAIMILVFASIFAVGRWLFFSGGQTQGQPVSAQIVSTPTLMQPASPQGRGTAIVGQSLSPLASPKLTAAPSSTRVASVTPTPKSAVSVTPTPKSAASATPTPKSAVSATPTSTPDTSTACVGDGVYVYQNSNYSGICEKFTANAPELRGTLVGSDTATSIKIVGNYIATLYADTNYQGASSVVTSAVPYLGALAVGNDALSSLKVQHT